ncbi:phage tail length tape measure family protein [Arsenophonus apicola]|uniref:Phage tail length tape measure family protein n=1 Tax=Arsenophonus apicola TaxID=2879119 RepID=A0ABY8P802_9GAMM|nr:phage tail length tape measure family protein [Arsenophonus apicola]WGO84709.1 phage tail length tape measure family protein [Arsenophonus apicola]
MLELKAAQMGVSQQAAPMIARLKQQEKAFMNGALTVGQYRYAMRMLPMQMTDVVTLLVSGMPAWMVLVQQYPRRTIIVRIFSISFIICSPNK